MSESFTYLQSADPRYEAIVSGALAVHDEWLNTSTHIADRIPFEGLRSAVQNWAALTREQSLDNLAASTVTVANRLQQAAEDASYKSAAAISLTDQEIKQGNIQLGDDFEVKIKPNYRSFELFEQEVHEKATEDNLPTPDEIQCAYDQVIDEGVADFRRDLMLTYSRWQEVAELTPPERIAKHITGVLIGRHQQYFRNKLKTLIPYAEADWRTSGDATFLYKLGRIASFGLAYREEARRQQNLRSAIADLSREPDHAFDVNEEEVITRELKERGIVPQQEQAMVAQLYYRTTGRINERLSHVLNKLLTPEGPTPESVRTEAEAMMQTGESAKRVMRRLSYRYHPDHNKGIDEGLYKALQAWYTEKTAPQTPPSHS